MEDFRKIMFGDDPIGLISPLYPKKSFISPTGPEDSLDIPVETADPYAYEGV